MKVAHSCIGLLAGLLSMWTASAYDFTYDAGDIEGSESLTGITYTLNVSKGNLGTSYDFDTKDGVTSGSPSGIDISVNSGGATGTMEYANDSLPTSNFTISMNGKLIPPSGGEGSQPTWGASGNAQAPFFLTSDSSKIIWIGDQTSFETNLDADWYIDNKKEHTGKTFTIGVDWKPINLGSYTIIAKKTTNNNETASASLIVAQITSLSIDATTPSAAKILYKLEPESVTCSATFTVNNSEASKSVSGSFNFTFDQTQLLQNSTLHLELSNSELSTKSVDVFVGVDSVDKTASNSLVAWIAIEGVGFRSFPWSGTDSYTRYSYSCPESGKLIRLTPKNSSSIASLSAYMSFVNTGLNDSDYLLAFSHQFSDESSLTYLDKNLTALSPAWRCRGKDITSDKTKNIGATIRTYLTASTPSGPAFTIQGGTSVSLSLN